MLLVSMLPVNTEYTRFPKYRNFWKAFADSLIAPRRQAVESAHAERAALARQLAGTEEELGKLKANKAGEIQRLTKERADLQAKLAEAEQTAQKAKVSGSSGPSVRV